MPDENDTDDTYIELDSDLLLLAASASERDRAEVIARIEDMTPAERRLLREAVTRLDDWLDAAALDQHLRR
jgi:hypothetical protein